ncbi:MAG TPA: secretin N-terminal domain-containing protein [Rhabdochlamydiaceae bacterium]|nr:secretin N-terminal domain-containing protein [Rhabdochlamydiaceae bacterium]
MKEIFWRRREFLSCLVCLSCFYIGAVHADDPALQDLAGSFEDNELVAKKDDSKHWTLLRTGDSADDRYLINFNNVSIIEYIRFISKITGTNFIFEENELQFNVTIVSEDPITLKNIMSALIQSLRIHNLNLLEQDNNFIITTSKSVNQFPAIVSQDISDEASVPPLITRVFRVKNANLAAVAGIIKPMMSAAAIVDVYNETRQLIVTDISTNVEKVATLLTTLDTTKSPLEIEAYKAKYLPSDTLIEAAKQIITPIAGSNPLIFVPQKETNTIFIVSTPNLNERALEVIEDLDVEVKDITKAQLSNEKVYLYKVLNKAPEEVISELGQISKDLESASSPSFRLIRALKKVKSLRDSNSLLFITDPDTYAKIEDILKTLDTSPTTKSNFFIYKIQQASQAQIEHALDDLSKTLKKSSSDKALVDAIKSMKYIKETDSFIFTGTDEALKKIADLLPTFDAAAFPSSHYWLYTPQFMTGKELESSMMDIRKNLESSGLSDQALLTTIRSMKWVPATNSLIFTGDPKSLDHIQSIIKLIDVDSTATSSKIFLYSPQNLTRNEIEDALDELTEKLDHKNIADRNLAAAIDHMTWIPESQSLLFKSDAATIEKLQNYLKSIDNKPKSTEGAFFVYNLKYANGEHIISSLEKVALDMPKKDPKQKAIIKVIDEASYLKETNSILLKGTQEAIDEVKLLIEQFDTLKAKPASFDKTDFFIYKAQHLSPNVLESALKETARDLQSSGLVDQNLLQSIETMRFVDATNSFVFTGTKESLDKTKEILQIVDVPTVEEGQLAQLAGQTFLIYKVKAVSIAHLLTLLKDVSANLAKTDVKSNRDLIRAIDNAKSISETHSLLFVGTPETLERITALLKQLDASGACSAVSKGPPSYVIYKPDYVGGLELISLLQDFEQNLSQSGVQDSCLFDVLNNLKYIEKTGYILIAGDQPSIDKVQELIKKFDQPGIETGVTSLSKLKTSFLVYKLRYHQGTDIQTALKQVAQNLNGTEGLDKNIVTAINSLQWLKITNSMLATGTPEVLAQLRELIQNVDIPLRQVFIEVLIIETSIADNLTFGLQWGGKMQYLNKFAANTGNFPGGNPLTPTITPSFPLSAPLNAVNATTFPTTGPTGISEPSSASGGFDLGVIGDIIMHKGRSFISLGSLVQALQADGDQVIVMNPKIIAQDNQQSNIFVGQNIPFAGSAFQLQGANAVSSSNIEYRDVGVNMSITPILSTDDIITLDISNDISQQVLNTQSNVGGIQGLQTTHTTLSARVSVPNNHFVALSGMIQDIKSHAKTGIPCLGGLPVIGAMFSVSTSSMAKNNVIFFIRPTIIETVEQYKRLTELQECQYKEQAVMQTVKEEIDAAIDSVKQPEDED